MNRIALAFLFACAAPAQEKKPQPATLPAEVPTAASRPVPKPLGLAQLDESLPPRTLFFGNPERTMPQVSPDGRHLAFLAPKDGVLNVWLAEKGDVSKAKPITDDKGRGIRGFFWAHTNKHILYTQDKGGDENWRVYATDIINASTKDLTPVEKTRAMIVGVSHHKPKQIVVALNDRTPEYFDNYLIDIITGERKLQEKNDQGFSQIYVDDKYVTRLATRQTPDGGYELLRKDKDKWTVLRSMLREDALTTRVVDFDASGKTAYWIDSTARDTGALFTLNLEIGDKQLIAEDLRADIQGVMLHPTKSTLQAYSVNWDKVTWKAVDKTWGKDFEAMQKTLGAGEMAITSRTRDDRTWIVAQMVDDGPVKFHRWERASKKATFLFSNRPALEKVKLAHMQPIDIKSRDGLTLMSYLTRPEGEAKGLVLLVHGGPWGRDVWGYDAFHQWLQSRGYAVLSVNFRGSTGFGKAFVNAGDKEWGKKMQDDLLDAVKWAVDEKVTTPDKVAIMGGSYGGYATLAGLAFTPEAFACGVDIVGPSNLRTLLASIPPYWKPMLDMFYSRMGDPTTEGGGKLLDERSPVHKASDIQRPLLIGQGANDPRVKQAESDQIVKAMQDKGLPVTYVLYPDEGHGFKRPENQLSFNAITEVFLSQCLGGKAQPIGNDFAGSSITVPHGADIVDGLATALKK